MNLILLGPPGAGKGTQAKEISAKYALPHISTGDMFRETASSGSELGKKLQDFMSKGLLVPDDVVIEVVKARISKDDCKGGFLLDGFPRTVVQAQALDEVLKSDEKKIDHVLYIYLDNEEIVKRLSNRRMCPKCEANYNLISNPPRDEKVCDKCNAGLVQRADDNSDTIRKRLNVYSEQTSPLIDYYLKKDVIRKVNGQQTVGEVFKAFCDFIEG